MARCRRTNRSAPSAILRASGHFDQTRISTTIMRTSWSGAAGADGAAGPQALCGHRSGAAAPRVSPLSMLSAHQIVTLTVFGSGTSFEWRR